MNSQSIFQKYNMLLKLMAVVLIVLIIGAVPAHAGVEYIVFDYDVSDAISEKWIGPAFTDLTIKILNIDGKTRALPRGDLRRMLHRRGAGSERNLSMEKKEEYRSAMGAGFFVEGRFDEKKGIIYFTGTYINPDSGEVKDISFEEKAGRYEDIARKFISKFSPLVNRTQPLSFASAEGTGSIEAVEKCWEGVYEYEYGDVKKAEKLLIESTQQAPGYAEPLYILGRIFMERADLAKAGGFISSAARLDSGSHRAYFWLGFMAFLKADNFKAEEYMMKALALYPENPEYLYQTGMIFRKTFRYAEAVAKFKSAVEVDPTIADAWYQLASIYASMKRKDETISNLGQAINWGGLETANKAKNDSDFKWLSGDREFLRLFESHSGHGEK